MEKILQGEAGRASSPHNRTNLFQRLNAVIRHISDRYLNLWSVVTLFLVGAILLSCVLLWDVVSFRPVLATIGAGLAAFLGPIPGIISPEVRSKWLVTIVVSALIAAGTWFATQDLANHLQLRSEQAEDLSTRLKASGDAIVVLMKKGTPSTRDAMFLESSRLLYTHYHARQYEHVIDLASALARTWPDSGTALAYLGYANRALGRTDEAKKYFENYISQIRAEEHALNGPQKFCYERADGYCAERSGWVRHLRATIALREALVEEGAIKLKRLKEAFEHERENILIVKFNRPGKDEGFDAKDEEPLSSCDVLRLVAEQLTALQRPSSQVLALRAAKLNCE